MFYESNKQGQGIIFNTIMMSSPPGDGAEINTFLDLLFISVTDTMGITSMCYCRRQRILAGNICGMLV